MSELDTDPAKGLAALKTILIEPAIAAPVRMEASVVNGPTPGHAHGVSSTEEIVRTPA